MLTIDASVHILERSIAYEGLMLSTPLSPYVIIQP